MHTSLRSFRGILLVFWFELVTVFGTTIDPASFYQRSNDGSYRYGYSAGGGFSARQSATSANEVIGRFGQLQPDGRILDVRYKASVGGYRPQYGSASSSYNGAAFGVPGSLGGLAGGPYSVGSLSSGSFGSRSLTGGSTLGSGTFSTPRLSIDGSLNGGSFEGYLPGYGPYAGGSFSAGGRSLAGRSPFGPGPLNAPKSFVGGGSTAGGFNGDASLGPGSPTSRSPIGGSLGIGHIDSAGLYGSGQVPGSIGSRASLGRPYHSTDLTGSSYGGFPYQSYGGDSSARGRRPFAYPPTSQPFFIGTTSRPIFNTGSLGDGSYRFSYANDNAARNGNGDPSGIVSGSYPLQNGAGNHDLSYVAGPNTGFQPTGSSLATQNSLPKSTPSTIRTPVTVSQSGSTDDFAYRTSSSQAVPNGINQKRPSIVSSASAPIDPKLTTTTASNGGPTIDRSSQNVPPESRNTGRSGLTNNDQRLLGTSSIRPTSVQNSVGGVGEQGSNDVGGVERQSVGGDSSNTIKLSGDTTRQTGVGGSRGSGGTLSNGGLLSNPGNGLSNGARSSNGLTGNGSAFGNSYGISGSGTGSTNANGIASADGTQGLQGASGSGSNDGLSLNRENGLSYGAGFGSGLSGNGGALGNSRGISGSGGNDGSYFSYDAGRQAHQENSDGRGRTDGSYSYLGDGGQRSLSYRARPGTGFQVIGGNLASKTPK